MNHLCGNVSMLKQAEAVWVWIDVRKGHAWLGSCEQATSADGGSVVSVSGCSTSAWLVVASGVKGT
jgi:hypothetical protein